MQALCRSISAALLLSSLTVLPAVALAPGVVERRDETIAGVAVDTYAWLDSKGLERTVSLKKQGAGNTGNGGYAVRATYQYVTLGKTQTVVASAPNTADGGFGYFVGHERYRSFADGDVNTIAGKIFRRDDSPLGRGFPATITRLAQSKPSVAVYRAQIAYPRYGTVAANGYDADGLDFPRLPTDPAKYAKFTTPVTTLWIFEAGRDYPRIRTRVDLSAFGPGQTSFDVRGPYGVLEFDGGQNLAISKVGWGDRYHFASSGKPFNRSSAWTWNLGNQGGRYNALVAGAFEMGLFEPRTFQTSALRDGWSGSRGKTSSTVGFGDGCGGAVAQELPSDWEWPYQSVQYSLPCNKVDQTSFKKMSWGSISYYGAGSQINAAWDTSSTSSPFVGYPASKAVQYDVCLVLGRATIAGLTKTAASLATTTCATGTP